MTGIMQASAAVRWGRADVSSPSAPRFGLAGVSVASLKNSLNRWASVPSATNTFNQPSNSAIFSGDAIASKHLLETAQRWAAGHGATPLNHLRQGSQNRQRSWMA